MSTIARARSVLPDPVLTASGCAAAGRELDPFVDLAAIGAVVTKSDHAQAAVGSPDAPDGRDSERDAQLDRPAGPRRRRVPRERPRLAARARCTRRGVHRGQHHRRVHQARAAAAPRRRHDRDRGEHLLPQRGEPRRRCSRATRRPLPRSSQQCAATARPACRCSPSSPPMSQTSSRWPGRCVSAGADGLSLINTLLGMVIDAGHHATGARRRDRRPVRPGDPAGRRPLRVAGARGDARGADPRHGRHPHGTRRAGVRPRRRLGRVGRHRDLQRPGRVARVSARARVRRSPTAGSTGSPTPSVTPTGRPTSSPGRVR